MRMNKFTFDILNLFDEDLNANETLNLLTNEHIDIDYMQNISNLIYCAYNVLV